MRRPHKPFPPMCDLPEFELGISRGYPRPGLAREARWIRIKEPGSRFPVVYREAEDLLVGKKIASPRLETGNSGHVRITSAVSSGSPAAAAADAVPADAPAERDSAPVRPAGAAVARCGT